MRHCFVGVQIITISWHSSVYGLITRNSARKSQSNLSAFTLTHCSEPWRGRRVDFQIQGNTFVWHRTKPTKTSANWTGELSTSNFDKIWDDGIYRERKLLSSPQKVKHDYRLELRALSSSYNYIVYCAHQNFQLETPSMVCFWGPQLVYKHQLVKRVDCFCWLAE